MRKASFSQYLQIGNLIDSGAISRELAQAIIEGRVDVRNAPSNGSQTLPPDHYLVHVTYAPVPSRSELEKEFSGNDSVSVVFDGRTWELHESCQGMDETSGDRAFWVAEPPSELLVDSEKIITWAATQKSDFAPRGYRPATHQEEIEFARKHPDLQRKLWIVALGSFALRDDGRNVAVLDSGSGGRVLRGDWLGGWWSSDDRFLLVRR